MRAPPSLKFFLAGCLIAGGALAQSPAEKLNHLQADLASSKQDAEAIADQIAENERHLGGLRERSADLADDLQDTEARVGSEEEKSGKLDNELNAKQEEFDRRRRQYADTVASLLAMRRIPPTALFAEPDNIHPMMRTASVLEKANEALAARAAGLRQDMDELTLLKTRAAQSREKLRREKLALAKQQDALDKELANRQEAQRKLQGDHAKAEARVAELSRRSSSLAELINKLQKQPAAGRVRSQPRDGNFAAAKGTLRQPAVGDVVHRFGEKKNENESWRGMVLKARPGGSVVAPYAGEVVFTGPFMNYGRMVLLKHDNGYISLLAGLGSIGVTLNQVVGKGEPVGSMPREAAPTLYVELRDHSKPIDPAGWFANVGRKLAKS